MIAIDYETTYEKGRDIKSLGVQKYVQHPETAIYLVSLYGEGVEYSGPPETAPWGQVAGKPWCAHNRSFDSEVHAEAIRRGQIPETAVPSDWECTADLCAFLQAPRELAKAAKVLLGVELDKDVRDRMRGQTWATMTPEFRAEAADYALDDSKACWLLWESHGHEWPEHERLLSKHTTKMTHRGIGVDPTAIQSGTEILRQALFKAEKKIPWLSDELTVLSRNALAAECRKNDIPPPTTTAKDSPIFDAWLEEYSEKAPFVSAMRDWRRTNRLLQVLLAFDRRSFGDNLPYSLKYGGAQHTMRWSGDSGLNLQNLDRTPYKSTYAEKPVHSRECLMAPPGHVFVLADLNQIEARVLLWLARDHKSLELVRQGMCIYEAHARINKGYNEKQTLKELAELDPQWNNLRQLCKAERLGLGFGMGASRFISAAKKFAEMDIDPATAEAVVDNFRNTNKPITDLWARLRMGVCRRGNHTVELPSGRIIRYFDVFNDSNDWRARVERGGPAVRIFHGLLTENVVQATSRDLLGHFILETEKHVPVVLHVHDEIVTCVPKDRATETKELLLRIMSTAPDWAEGLPLSASAKITERYTK